MCVCVCVCVCVFARGGHSRMNVELVSRDQYTRELAAFFDW
jgi:hypothetical protein